MTLNPKLHDKIRMRVRYAPRKVKTCAACRKGDHAACVSLHCACRPCAVRLMGGS